MHLYLSPGPQWFSGADFIVDLFSMVILLLISVSAWKYYSINKNTKHLTLFVSLATLGVSFLFKIIAYLLLYTTKFKMEVLSVLGELVLYMEPTNKFFSISFMLYSILTLVGFYLLYTIYEREISRRTTFLILYMLLIVAVFSENAYLFLHLTAMLLSVFITYSLWKNYTRNNLKSTKYLAVGFGILSASRIFFLLANSNPPMYVVGEIVQFLGYLLLLLTFITVLKNGKKTGTDKNN
jgi:hypothetical protein